MRWHFLLSPAADGVANMALDEALMRRAALTQTAVLRVYGWSSPTLSLGRNQRARGCYDLAAAATLGVGFVRRPTGGRALLHHREITYSVTMPVAGVMTSRAAYGFINEVLLAGLDRLGVTARTATTTQALSPGLRPCFDVPAAHEIVFGERKLVGSAQWRHKGALLQHGSILVRDDQPLIARLLRDTTLGADTAAATLADALGREPSAAEVAQCIRGALESETGGRVTDLTADAALEADTDALRVIYAKETWTWRR